MILKIPKIARVHYFCTESFPMTSYQPNFASHRTRDCHVAFLCARRGIGNATTCPVTCCSQSELRFSNEIELMILKIPTASYQPNFASHHTRDRHVAFLCARRGIGKHNKMSRDVLFSPFHNNKLQLSDKNISSAHPHPHTHPPSHILLKS